MIDKYKISLIINYLIIIFTIIAIVMMFTGLKFMIGIEPVLETTKLGMFKYFTVDSNLLMGISALIFVFYEIKLLNGSIKSIPKSVYLLKFIATVSVSLTFIVVFTYLRLIVDGGIMSLLLNSNLFLHLIIPLLSIITFVFFEKGNKISFNNVLYGLLPTTLYAIFYIINILLHLENGRVSPIYDWYWFVQGGINMAFIVVPIIFVITYIISLLLWFLNKKK